MQQMTPVPAFQQIDQLTQQLTQKLVQKADHEARVKTLDTEITAMRNVLAGVGLGQQLAAEMAPKSEPSAPERHVHP